MRVRGGSLDRGPIVREGLATAMPHWDDGDMDRDSTALTAHARDLGEPTVDLTKANQVAANLEDEELLRKMAQGK